MKTQVASLMLTLCLGNASLLAAPAEPPVFRVALDMVKVPVSVVDGKGRFVKNLDAADFQVLENGRPQEISLFARAAEPGQDETLSLDLGILFDTSESMLKVLKLSQEAAVRFLEAIPRAHDLLVIFFDQDIRISRYESERQQGLFERIYESKSGGNTALYDSIAVYLSRVQGQAGRKVLVLFTDGEDTTSTLTQGEALRFLRESGVIVYTIGFTEQVSGMRANQVRAFMNEMARMTGGQAFWPDTSKALPKIYDDIIEDLEGQYVLGYVPQGGSAKAGFRKLKIVVKKPGLKARHRNGYLAPGSHPDAATP